MRQILLAIPMVVRMFFVLMVMVVSLGVLLHDGSIADCLARRQTGPFRGIRDRSPLVLGALGSDVMRDGINLAGVAARVSSRRERHRKGISGVPRRWRTAITEFLSGLNDCRSSQRRMSVQGAE